MSRPQINIDARSSLHGGDPKTEQSVSEVPISEKLLDNILSELGSKQDSLLFFGGTCVLVILTTSWFYSPALCPLMYLAFASTCLPYRIVSFVKRKWTFFLVDFCYFANLACCAFLVLRPEDARLEATVYALCEGPLAAALIAWQCAWVLGSPDHAISVLIHLLPGLSLFCHRFLSHSRRPIQLLVDVGRSLAGHNDPWVAASLSSSGVGPGGQGAAHGGEDSGQGSAGAGPGAAALLWNRLQGAVSVLRGRVPCGATASFGSSEPLLGQSQAVAAAGGTCASDAFPGVGGGVGWGWRAGGSAPGLAGAGLACFSQPAAEAPPCPSPSWLWLWVAPLALYLAWQLVYFLVVQVACRQLILSGGYDTSYRALARRAQRADNFLHRHVRSGSVARRLMLYGVLQLLFTVVTQALAVATYGSFAAAAGWQVVKFAVPLYLGACHQCQRLPPQQLRTAAAKLVAAGVLDPRVTEPPPAKKKKDEAGGQEGGKGGGKGTVA